MTSKRGARLSGRSPAGSSGWRARGQARSSSRRWLKMRTSCAPGSPTRAWRSPSSTTITLRLSATSSWSRARSIRKRRSFQYRSVVLEPMARFWIGTSGWNYNHWRQNFYPKGLPSREWLAFYTTQFSTVELNYSFYRQPATRSWDAWRVAAPDGFRFAVKAHRYLTHRTRLNNPAARLDLS